MADNLQDPSDRRRALSAIFAVSLGVRAREKPPSLENCSLSAWPMERTSGLSKNPDFSQFGAGRRSRTDDLLITKYPRRNAALRHKTPGQYSPHPHRHPACEPPQRTPREAVSHRSRERESRLCHAAHKCRIWGIHLHTWARRSLSAVIPKVTQPPT